MKPTTGQLCNRDDHALNGNTNCPLVIHRRWEAAFTKTRQ